MSKEIIYDDEARTKLQEGVNQIARAIGVTLGPKGRNVIIDNGFGSPIITKDGVTVAREVILEDKFENMGAELIKEISSKTNDVAGDGTSTAAIIAQAIVNEGLRNVVAGTNPLAIKHGIDKGVREIVLKLKEVSKNISKKEDIRQVASISANDDEIGREIAEAMDSIDIKTGVITVEESQKLGIEREIIKGMQIDKGYVSPYMVTDLDRMKSTIDDAYVIVTDQQLTMASDVLPIMEKLMMKGIKELVIIAEEIKGSALTAIIQNRIKGIFNVLAIEAPSFGDNRKEVLGDIATLVGTYVLSQETGVTLDEFQIDDLGKAKITSTRNSTIITEGNGDKKDIDDRVKHIKNLLKTTEENIEKDKLKERLGKLKGGVAIIRVGTSTKTEMTEMKYRIEDALEAAKAAVEEGIVSGGGVALIRAIKVLDKIKVDGEEQIGIEILKRAIEQPTRMIAVNAGKDDGEVIRKIQSKTGNYGYNARTDKYEDLMEAGIVDPTKVTRSALENASSVASLLLTTEAAIINKPKDNEHENKTNQF